MLVYVDRHLRAAYAVGLCGDVGNAIDSRGAAYGVGQRIPSSRTGDTVDGDRQGRIVVGNIVDRRKDGSSGRIAGRCDEILSFAKFQRGGRIRADRYNLNVAAGWIGGALADTTVES